MQQLPDSRSTRWIGVLVLVTTTVVIFGGLYLLGLWVDGDL